MKTVIIGFGKSAFLADIKMSRWFPKGGHALCLNDHSAFDFVGVADCSGRARLTARRYTSARVVVEAAELASLNPEVAVLAIPPEGRAEVLAALPSVRAVMLEKPLGPPSVREPLLELIEKRKIVTQVAYWRRGDPTLRTLPDIGRPQAAFGLYGGGLRNNGSHLIDMVRMLWGDDQWDKVSLRELDFRHYREVSLDIWGERGRITIEQEGLLIRYYRRAAHRGLKNADEIACDSPVTLPCRVGEALPALYSNLYRAITEGEPLLSPIESAVKTELVLDAIEAQ